VSELSFTFVDIEGNALRFDSLRYERPGASGSDGEWVSCQIKFNAKEVHHTVDAAFLTFDLSELKRATEVALGGGDVQYESTEPWVHLAFSRSRGHIDILARLSITLGLGPIIEYNFECREDEIKNSLCELVSVVETFPYLPAET
jgi:hypothetical protein